MLGKEYFNICAHGKVQFTIYHTCHVRTVAGQQVSSGVAKAEPGKPFTQLVTFLSLNGILNVSKWSMAKVLQTVKY